MSASERRCVGFAAASENEEIDLLLSEYVDGELDAADVARVEAHVAACPACASDLAFMRATSFVMTRRTPDVFPPVALFDRVAQMTYARPTWKQRFARALSPAPVRIGVGTALAAGVLAVVVMPQLLRSHESGQDSGGAQNLAVAPTAPPASPGRSASPANATNTAVASAVTKPATRTDDPSASHGASRPAKPAPADEIASSAPTVQRHSPVERNLLSTVATPQTEVVRVTPPKSISPMHSVEPHSAIHVQLPSDLLRTSRSIAMDLPNRGGMKIDARELAIETAGVKPAFPTIGAMHPTTGGADAVPSAAASVADSGDAPRPFHVKLSDPKLTWDSSVRSIPGAHIAASESVNILPGSVNDNGKQVDLQASR